MRNKGSKKTSVESRVGEVQIRRGYYYCTHCQRGFPPLDEQLGTCDRQWSEGVVKAAAWLSGLVPFVYAEQILAQIGQVQMSTSSIWRYTQEVGRRFSEVETQGARQASASPVKWMAPEQMAPSTPRMGAAMDGTMMHIRQEGWKELKVGTVFEVAMVASTFPEARTNQTKVMLSTPATCAIWVVPNDLVTRCGRKRASADGSGHSIPKSSVTGQRGSGILPSTTLAIVVKAWTGTTPNPTWLRPHGS